MKLNIHEITCDILVVGGGGGGIRAALAARGQDDQTSIYLATKGKLGQSGVTALACSDRMAFHATLPHTEPLCEDSWFYHARDIYEIGGRVSDANLAAILAANACEAFEYLLKLGVPFVTCDGKTDQFVTDGSHYARACYTGPYTAVHIEQALVEEFKRNNIGLLENCSIIELISDNEGIRGAIGLLESRQGEELLVVNASSVIMASGGGGLIYADNVFPRGNSGSGAILAYRAGAELVNMEFIQFGIASVKTRLNCSGSMMRAFPRFVNDQGREFISDYLPEGIDPSDLPGLIFRKGATWPVSYEHDTRIIDIAVYKERKNGRKVYLDYSKNPRGFTYQQVESALKERYRGEIKNEISLQEREESPLKRLQEINPDSVSWLEKHGIDITSGEMVEVAVCAQHFQGGIKINDRGETAVRGLYAVGECAGGQHGANRPGGNALLDGQVFGKITGAQAALRAKQTEARAISKSEVDIILEKVDDLYKSRGLTASEYLSRLQKIMSSCAGVVRTAEGLKEGLVLLEELRQMPFEMDSSGLVQAVELPAMTTLAEVVLRSAQLRDESRGPHLRFTCPTDNTPLPRRDPQWQRYIVIKEISGQAELEPREPVKQFE